MVRKSQIGAARLLCPDLRILACRSRTPGGLLKVVTLADQRLPPRQREILALAAEGLSNLAIGNVLGLTEKSVENNMSRVYSELGIREDADRNSRVTAVRMWLESHPDE